MPLGTIRATNNCFALFRRCYMCLRLTRRLLHPSTTASAMTFATKYSPVFVLIALRLVFPHVAAVQSCTQTGGQCPPPSKTPFEAMEALLDSSSGVKSFFSSHFEQSFMKINHSARSNRPFWMQHYRRFLPSADLDLILSHNASSSHPTDTLRPKYDLDVLRVADVDGVHAWHPLAVTGSLESLRDAVRAGAVLQLYNMSSRSYRVALFEDALRSFWAVPVSSTFSFHPAETISQPQPAPTVHASEVFFVVLRGSARVHLYEDYFLFPCPHHVENPSIQSMVHKKCRQPSKKIDLDEGDVLYIPRGVAVDMRTTNSPALILQFDIHTHQRLVFHGLLNVIDVTRRSADLLARTVAADDELNLDDTDIEALPTWAHVMSTAVQMAAEFNPAMRKFLPVMGGATIAMRDAGNEVGERLLHSSIARFSRAAKDALFEPVLEVLASEDDNLRGIAHEAVITWAKSLWGRGHGTMAPARDIFQACVTEIEHSANELQDYVTSLTLDWQEQEDEDSPQRIRRQKCSLQRHQQLDDSIDIE